MAWIDELRNDLLVPANLDIELAKYDNYGIYSVGFNEYTETSQNVLYTEAQLTTSVQVTAIDVSSGTGFPFVPNYSWGYDANGNTTLNNGVLKLFNTVYVTKQNGIYVDGQEITLRIGNEHLPYLAQGYAIVANVPEQLIPIPNNDYPVISIRAVKTTINVTTELSPQLTTSSSFEHIPNFIGIVAYQTYDIHGLVPLDYIDIIKAYPIKPLSIFKRRQRYRQFGNNSKTYNSMSFPQGKDTANYTHLISGHPSDNRVIPTKITGKIAPFTDIKYRYYRHNKLESHPVLFASLDWITKKTTSDDKGNFQLNVKDIALGTLIVNSSVRIAIESDQVAGSYYPNLYLFSNNLSSLIDQWSQTYSNLPAPPQSSLPYANTQTSINYLDNINELPLAIDLEVFTSYAPKVTRLSATNDYWNLGNNLSANVDRPITKIDLNFENLFTNLQLDGSYGTYVMDSIRLIQIHAALEAEKYSTNLTTVGATRVTTLGWMIEAANRVLGLRFDDNGKIDMVAEKNKYLPATLNNPKHPVANAYGVNCWGTQGMYVSFLPTTYNDKGKEEKLWDVVHDIPQLLNAKERALNASIGIQHGSQIRMRGIDGKVQSYPDQLALLKSMAYQVEKSAYTIQKLQIQITTIGMEVRDLYSGIGIPVSTKFTDYNDGTKTYQVPYIGYQKSKPGILNHLTDIKVNLGIINGVLMPKKQSKKTGVLNPFDVFNGKS